METPMPAIRDLWDQLFRLKPKEELLQLVFNQLSRDFSRAGLELPFDLSIPAEQWAKPLSELLSKADNQTLRSLIYLVDLHESLTARMLTAPDPFDRLAEAILHRELVKIYFQLYYSAGN